MTSIKLFRTRAEAARKAREVSAHPSVGDYQGGYIAIGEPLILRCPDGGSRQDRMVFGADDTTAYSSEIPDEGG